LDCFPCRGRNRQPFVDYLRQKGPAGKVSVWFTPEFWKRAQELTDARPRKCECCGKIRTRADSDNVRLVCRNDIRARPVPADLSLQCRSCWDDERGKICTPGHKRLRPEGM
jgi:hypothetical protein